VELRTVPEALDRAAEREGAGFTFVADDGTEDEHSFARLAAHSRELAHALSELGAAPGDRVALILPHSGEFVPAFLGCVRGGFVPVPLYPPMGLGQLGGYLDHAKHIVSASGAKVVITTGQIKAVLGKLHDYAPRMSRMVTFSELQGDAALFREPDVKADDLCFLQFTSGSTSKPKGVIVTHANLAHNCHAIMRDGLTTAEVDRGVSWLPLFHDMGLIGFVLAPIFHRVPVTFMSPLTFLKRPASWLEYLSKHRGTITYGPNFAYAIATKRVRERDLEGLDLSCVRVAGCGAEPIQAGTLRAFADKFSRVGFDVNAFVPSYGMAENTLAIAFSQGVPTDVVRADELWGEGVAVPAGGDDAGETVEIVGCGPAFPDHRIRIVDPETREPLPERRVGEIELQGPSVTPGYFEDEESTRKTIVDGWLSTGDLGYLAGDEIFICGRQKDVIIVNGKNYYPQDLEWAATEVDGIRAGNAIAFPSYQPGLGREAVVVVAETREADGHDELQKKVVGAIQSATGLTVDAVSIVAAGTIPKTSSGKLQRRKARELFESGGLEKREDESKLRTAARVAESQLAHLRLRIFGRRG
jgi:acyl-CoA synthetase (AMP-forming)/AMP-acid ligase II